jgi:YesN/AraC family two-component response regulator
VTDIRMPYMNGLEMVKNIKIVNPNVKVIYISGNNDADVLVQAINAGADGFIVKPVSVKTRLMSALYRISKDIYKDKVIKHYYKTLKLILDCVDNMIILTNGSNILEVNEAFLDFFGVSTLSAFKERHSNISEKFIGENDYLKKDYGDEKTWVEVAMEVDEAKAKIKGIEGNVVTFLVQVNPMYVDDDDVVYVVEFTNITKLLDKKCVEKK